ncbi:hypothetical protein SAMN05878503_10235 [Cereibacter ovatus]|uniref:Amine oxidase domain-containing protein n=1 Tax=Cereibacter ovatus TaxID=439529 RepID=A0A285CMP2_9RHOB|nr:FAD-dependent oxidoreductase [Cereibacter ovatus]SNX68263.1 hypothetical protein SAMN05878503_10235 [Cereibacter ovatus]
MPFETSEFARRRVAVIGAGISGMAAAHLLARDHSVVLIEAEKRLGGHARTVIAGKRGDQPVDTGFIVYNKVNYPHLTRLFDDLQVPVVKSDMSFGASVRGGRLEYGLKDLGAVFAQKKNALDPRFLGMLMDILRFNAHAAEHADDPVMTIRDLLERLDLGAWFRDYYLLPVSGAIWSTPSRGILDFPAQALIRFFQNHALLSHRDQHQWYTVAGGSVEYVSRLQAAMGSAGVDMRTGAAVAGVRRLPDGVQVRCEGGDWEAFDEVIFATHSDDTLRLLSDATPEESAALGSVRYQPNHAVLHSDTSVMPKRKAAWASWVYVEPDDPQAPIDITYWMNSLQPIPHDDPLFVTLNGNRTVREDLVHDVVTFRHPVYDLNAQLGVAALRMMNGKHNTWFAGAWMRNGFHEDGFASAVDVVEAMRRRIGVAVAA